MVKPEISTHMAAAIEEATRLQELAETHDISFVKLRAAADSVPVLNKHAQEHIEGWLRKEARVIEEFSNERIDMLRRLQMTVGHK